MSVLSKFKKIELCFFVQKTEKLFSKICSWICFETVLRSLNCLKLADPVGPIRTASLIPVKAPLDQTIAVYQKLAPKIKEMKALGMSYRDISVSLDIDKKTLGRALSF